MHIVTPDDQNVVDRHPFCAFRPHDRKSNSNIVSVFIGFLHQPQQYLSKFCGRNAQIFIVLNLLKLLTDVFDDLLIIMFNGHFLILEDDVFQQFLCLLVDTRFLGVGKHTANYLVKYRQDIEPLLQRLQRNFNVSCLDDPLLSISNHGKQRTIPIFVRSTIQTISKQKSIQDIPRIRTLWIDEIGQNNLSKNLTFQIELTIHMTLIDTQ